MLTGRPQTARHIRWICVAVLPLLIRGVLAEGDQLDLRAFQPQWQVGQKWEVETIMRQTQEGRTPEAERRAKPVRWQFEVQGVEPCDGQDCYRVRIRSLLPGVPPESMLWVERQSMTLRRLRMQIPAADGLRTIEETYRSASGQPFPAFAAISVPPVVLPVFLSGTKGQATFHYESASRSDGAKALGDLGFGFVVEQTVHVPRRADAVSLLPEDHAKVLQQRPTIQVRLKSARDMGTRSLPARAMLVLVISLCPGVLPGQIDEGMARHVPWSGSYWPIRQGALILGPLTKYDRTTGHQAAAVAQHYRARFDGQPEDDPQDIYPDQLWRVLRLFLQQRGIPLIVDIEGGTQVWNYPVYAYRVDYRPAGSGNWYLGEMTLWMADDAVSEDMVGVKVSKQSYYFRFQIREGAAQLGSGRWVEPIIDNHPDFAWYPYLVQAENPELHYDKVKQLVDRTAAGPTGETVVPPAFGESNEPGIVAIPLDSQIATSVVPIPPPNVVRPNTVPAEANGVGGPRPGVEQPVERPPAGTSSNLPPRLLSPIELLSLVTDQTSKFILDVTVDTF
jgi:hypothetical protein